jgi:hypothetical protein
MESIREMQRQQEKAIAELLYYLFISSEDWSLVKIRLLNGSFK